MIEPQISGSGTIGHRRRIVNDGCGKGKFLNGIFQVKGKRKPQAAIICGWHVLLIADDHRAGAVRVDRVDTGAKYVPGYLFEQARIDAPSFDRFKNHGTFCTVDRNGLAHVPVNVECVTAYAYAIMQRELQRTFQYPRGGVVKSHFPGGTAAVAVDHYADLQALQDHAIVGLAIDGELGRLTPCQGYAKQDYYCCCKQELVQSFHGWLFTL